MSREPYVGLSTGPQRLIERGVLTELQRGNRAQGKRGRAALVRLNLPLWSLLGLTEQERAAAASGNVPWLDDDPSGDHHADPPNSATGNTESGAPSETDEWVNSATQ